MKSNKKMKIILICLLLIACLTLSALAGCEGIQVPSALPSGNIGHTATESPVPTITPLPATPAGETITPAVTPQPTVSVVENAPATGTPDPTATAAGFSALPGSASPTETPQATPAPVDSSTLDPAVSTTPAPSAMVAPSPTPTIAPAHPGDRDDIKVAKYYSSTIPVGLMVDLKYKSYAAPLDYFVVMRASNIRELPDKASKSLQRVRLADRLELLAQVKSKDGKSTWYRVRITGNKAIGYIPAADGSVRVFQLSVAWEKAKELKIVADQPNTVRINNYKNMAGMPPALPGGPIKDSYGYLRDMGAPAYLAPDKTSSFRYAPDGMIGQMLSTKGDFIEVYFPTFDEVRYVPKKYLSYKNDIIKTMTQAIAVDRKNQNIVTFECREGQWYIVSMCFVSTGASGGFYQPTPLGYFFPQKQRLGKYKLGEFWFLADGQTVEEGIPVKYEGYAPYAIRFTSGAYLHGLPKGVTYDANNQLVMPKSLTVEFNTCLGTTPQSHMCVRNYTSHAKFMYNWIKTGSAGVVVIQ